MQVDALRSGIHCGYNIYWEFLRFISSHHGEFVYSIIGNCMGTSRSYDMGQVVCSFLFLCFRLVFCLLALTW